MLIDEVRTGRDFQAERPALQLGFELPYDFCIKNMLYKIGIAIHVRGCNISVANQVEFPESVVPGNPGRFPKASLREPDLPLDRVLKMIFCLSSPQQKIEL